MRHDNYRHELLGVKEWVILRLFYLILCVEFDKEFGKGEGEEEGEEEGGSCGVVVAVHYFGAL